MRKSIFVGLFAALFSLSAGAVDFNPASCKVGSSEVFVSGFQRFAKLKNRSGDTSKTEYNPTAVALGYQYSTAQWSAGLSMSYEGGNVKHDFRATDEYAKVQDRTLGFTLFGTYKFGDGYYAKASTMLGFARQKVKSGYFNSGRGYRTYSGSGHEDTTRFGASVELGKVFDLNSFRLTPHVGMDYAHLPSESIPYFDSLAGRDNSPWDSQNVYEIPLGVTFAKDFVTCDWVITPSVDVTMVSRIGHIKDRNINARPGFASRTGSEWKVYGAGAGKWGARLTAGVKAVKSERFDIDVNYAYEGRKKYNDHRISATFGFAF